MAGECGIVEHRRSVPQPRPRYTSHFKTRKAASPRPSVRSKIFNLVIPFPLTC